MYWQNFSQHLILKRMKTLEFQVGNYSVKNICCMQITIKIAGWKNRNIGQSHKYCSTLAFKKKKRLRLEKEDEKHSKNFKLRDSSMQHLIARFYASRAIFACRLHTKQHWATITNNNFSTCWAHDGVITRKQKKNWAWLFPEYKNSTTKSTIDPSYKWIIYCCENGK